MPPSGCVFCAISRGEATPEVVAFRDDETVVFPATDQRPQNRGHALVVPAAHVADIYAVDRAVGGALMSTVAAVARALKRLYRADGVSIRQNNEPAGGQDVFHVHFHVIPRFTNDGFDRGADRFQFGAVEVPLAARVAQSARLRQALERR